MRLLRAQKNDRDRGNAPPPRPTQKEERSYSSARGPQVEPAAPRSHLRAAAANQAEHTLPAQETLAVPAGDSSKRQLQRHLEPLAGGDSYLGSNSRCAISSSNCVTSEPDQVITNGTSEQVM